MSEFLRRRHGNKYYIINTSERQTYDADRYFGGRVTNYHWPDHHGPPFAFLYTIARQGYNWLKGKHSANCASIKLWWLTRSFLSKKLTPRTVWLSIAIRERDARVQQSAPFYFLWAFSKTLTSASNTTGICDSHAVKAWASRASFDICTILKHSTDGKSSRLQQKDCVAFSSCKYQTSAAVVAFLFSRYIAAADWTSEKLSLTQLRNSTVKRRTVSYSYWQSSSNRVYCFRAMWRSYSDTLASPTKPCSVSCSTRLSSKEAIT